MSGTFGTWCITTGSSGQLLNIQTPIESGYITLKPLSKTVDLSSTIPEMQVQLGFFDSSGSKKALKFNLKVVGNQAGDRTPGSVTTINPDTTGKISNQSIAWAPLHDNLPQMFIENKAQFSTIFANVNLVPPSSLSWLAPKEYVYAYNEPSGSAPATLVVFTSVTSRDVSHLSRVMAPNAIDKTMALNYLFSGGLFLQHVIMPALPSAFGNGAQSSNFEYANGKITNNGTLNAGSKKVGLIYYYPKVTSLSVTIDSDELVTQANGRFDISGLTDAYVTFTTTSRSEISFDRSTGKISFKLVNKSSDYSKHIPWWEWVVGLIGGAIILAVVDIVVEVVTSSLASSVSSYLSNTAGSSVANLADESVNWTGVNSFEVRNAGLSSNFYMQGELTQI